MITKISLKNFKCFENLDIGLRNVNVLTGINGMGKSTILQSLLLLKQTGQDLVLNQRVRLNGDMVQLGVGRDILCESAEDDSSIGIGIWEDGREKSYLFRYEPFSDILDMAEKCDSLPKFVEGGRSVYLSAYRIPPVNIYGITNDKRLCDREFGSDGIYTLQYLKEYGPQKATLDPEGGSMEPETLYQQVERWMGMIAPGVSVDINIDIDKQIATLGYSFVEGKNRTNTYSCVNVGFGITYVLPIVVALLSAKKGDLILLENPEAHIHPAGQRRLGELIATVGSAGVQVIVETHSDHILNGIRIAVKDHLIDKTDTNLLYFYKDTKDGYKHQYANPHIDENGRIDAWPQGFFDEWDNALLELL